MTGEPPLRILVLRAAREFNGGRYFEAHEAFEETLDLLDDDRFELFVGLVQIAVGYHKIGQGLLSGAVRMLELGLGKIESRGSADLDVASLCRRVRDDLKRLRSGALDAVALAADPPRIRPLPLGREPGVKSRE